MRDEIIRAVGVTRVRRIIGAYAKQGRCSMTAASLGLFLLLELARLSQQIGRKRRRPSLCTNGAGFDVTKR